MSNVAVAFDLDGVLCRTDIAILRACQERGYLTGRTEEDIRTFHFEEAFPDEITLEALIEIFKEGDPFRRTKPCRHMIGVLNALTDMGVDTRILTARSEFPIEETIAWLDRNGVRWSRLHYDVPHNEKAGRLKSLRISLLIEDRLATANAAASFCRSVLVAMPYNDPANGHDVHPEVLRLPREEISAERLLSLLNERLV